MINEYTLPDDKTLMSRAIPAIWIVVEAKNVDNIFRVFFDRKYLGTHATCFGDGVYSSYYLAGAQRVYEQSYYGDTIIMAKIPMGYKGHYLIFTEKEARYWYGDDWRIRDQLKYFTKDPELIDKFSSISARDLGKYYQKEGQKIGIIGMVYDWGGEHICTLPFDFKSVIPVAVSYDKGQTFQNKLTPELRQAYKELIDPVFILRQKYDRSQIGRAIYCRDLDCHFVVVKKGYNSSNVVRIKDEKFKEISPIDFQSIVFTNPNTGAIQVEYNRMFYDGYAWYEEIAGGIFEYNGEYYSFDELPQIDKMRHEKKSMNESLSEAENYRNYVGKYHIPTKDELGAEKGGAFYAYTVVYKKDVENLFRVGFARKYSGANDIKNSGTQYSWYGDGVYCTIKLGETIDNLNKGKYGDTIMRVAIVGGIGRFWIFNEHFARIVYGNNYSIKSQVYKLFGEDADDVWNDVTEAMRNNYDAREEEHFSTSRSSGLLQCLLYPRRSGVDKKYKYERLFAKHDIRGVIYKGGADGLCIVAYDYSSVIPVGILDYNTGKIVKPFDYDTFVNNMKYNVDAAHYFGHKYKQFHGMVFQGLNYDPQSDTSWETSFRKVTTYNGGVNYIDVNSGKKISPLDFSSCTAMAPQQNCSFQFSVLQKDLDKLGIINLRELSNEIFNAISYAYLDPITNEWTTFDELPDTLKNMDTNITNKKSSR